MLFIVKYIIYGAIYLLFNLLEWIVAKSGLMSIFVKCKPANSRTSKFQGKIQERRILFRHKANLAYPTSRWDFISWPSRSCDESAVLRDDVSLYCVTESHAWFVETPSDVDIYTSDTDPFLYAGQFRLAKRLYVVPMDVLIALGDLVGEPKTPVVVIWNHGRCGSTLLAQVFETVPDVVTLSEPDVLTNVLWLKWQNKISTKQLEEIVPALMKLLCQNMTERQVSLYCIKTRSPCIAIADIVAKHLQSTKHLYLYRNCASTVSSMERTFVQGLDFTEFWYNCFHSRIARLLLPKVTTNQLRAVFALFDMNNDRYKAITDPEFLASLTPLAFWTVNWGIPCAQYLHFLKSGIDIKGVRYEDLVSSTESVVRGLGQCTGIILDPELVINNVMSKDSQRGSNLNKDKFNSFKKLIPDEKSETEMKVICNKLGLPENLEETILEGTIKF